MVLTAANCRISSLLSVTGVCPTGTSFAIVRRSFALFLLSRTDNRRYRSPSQVHAQTVLPWIRRHGTLPWTGNGMPIDPSFLYPQKQLLLERYFPKLAVHNGRYSSIQQTQSCGKETPCGKSPSHLALGHRRCLIVSGFLRGCERPEMFSIADRQEKKRTPPFKQLRCMFSRFCAPSHTMPRKGL